MKLFRSRKECTDYIRARREEGNQIGFVPTMGALHEGHISLIAQSNLGNDLTVCSIFVNPIQFNNPDDLKKYPRTLEDDLKKLEDAGCDIVFNPEVDEMYPENEVRETYDFGDLERVMEGAHRPGHFNGVAVVVKRLFEICIPHRSYFGEKDYQQLAVVKQLVKQTGLDVEIVPCPIIREEDGLAMSSRNVRLTEEERKLAPQIYQTLKTIKDHVRKGNDLFIADGKWQMENVREVEQWATDQLNALPGYDVEYVEIVDSESLQKVENWDHQGGMVVCVATFLGNVRLIDNMVVRFL